MPIPISEQRYRDGLGHRFLQNGVTVRCQGVSKTKIRQLRITRNDPDLTSDDVWPEAQCIKSAEPDKLLCKFHGGRTPNEGKRRISDFMPLDLREKYEIFEKNPDIINRYIELAQLQARNASLFEQYEDLVLGEEAYETVTEARRLLARGDVVDAGHLLDIALQDAKSEREIWDELRKNMDLVDKLTRTQFSIEKELKTLATREQVTALMNGLFDAVVKAVEANVGDKDIANRILVQFGGAARQLANLSSVGSSITAGK